MKLSGTLLALASAAAVAAGCSGQPSPEPSVATAQETIEQAAKTTLAAQTSEIRISSEGASGQQYSYSGLIDVAAGNFDVRLDPDSAGQQTLTEMPDRLIAKNGEEAVNDVVRRKSPAGQALGSNSKECWFSNPTPVHINGGMSIEEGGTLAGSILESLPYETASAESIGDGLYAVELEGAAARPVDITKPGSDRVWGFRRLLSNLAAPIEVGVSDGRVSSLSLSVDGYRPHYSPGLFKPEPADTKPTDGVSLEIRFGVSDRELKVERPGCAIIT